LLLTSRNARLVKMQDGLGRVSVSVT